MEPPFVVVLDRARLRYDGRARARQRAERVVVVGKTDGSVVVHDGSPGVKPLFYNPSGRLRVRRRGDRVVVSAESRTGERLRVSGVPAFTSSLDEAGARKRRRVEGIEADLAAWLAANPRVLGLRQEATREARVLGGRVDLRFGDVAVEVKRRADVRALDQARRYLASPGIERVVIACLHATPRLLVLAESEDNVRVAPLDESMLPTALRNLVRSRS